MKSSSCADTGSTSPSSVRKPSRSHGPIDASRTHIHQSEYAVHTTLETVDYALGREPSSSLDRTPRYCKKKHGGFAQFVWRMICTSRVSAAVVLVALIYINRAKPHLRITTERWACERIFVGALVLAGKVSPLSDVIHYLIVLIPSVANQYLNDKMMKNVVWARCSGIFEHGDIGRMEREMLNILDWDLSVHEEEILAHQKFLSDSTASTPSVAKSIKLLPLQSVKPTLSTSRPPRPSHIPFSFRPAPVPTPKRRGSGSPRLIFGPGVRVAKAWPSPASSLTSSVSSSSVYSPAFGNRLGVLTIANNSSRDSLESSMSSDSP